MNACSGCNKNKICPEANESDGFEVCEKQAPLTCQYRNDDDGSDTAWCVQDFRKCDDERIQNCSLRLEASK